MQKVYAFFYGDGADLPKVLGCVPRPLAIRIGIFLAVAAFAMVTIPEFGIWSVLSLAPFAAGLYSFRLLRRVLRIQLSLCLLLLTYLTFKPFSAAFLVVVPLTLSLYSLRNGVWLFYSYAEGLVAVLTAFMLLSRDVGLVIVIVLPAALAVGIIMGLALSSGPVKSIPDIPLLQGDKYLEIHTGNGRLARLNVRLCATLLLLGALAVWALWLCVRYS